MSRAVRPARPRRARSRSGGKPGTERVWESAWYDTGSAPSPWVLLAVLLAAGGVVALVVWLAGAA